jgi:hypothetical protein
LSNATSLNQFQLLKFELSLTFAKAFLPNLKRHKLNNIESVEGNTIV